MPMNVVSLEKTALTLQQVAELAKSGPVILTRRGKPLASVRDLSRSDWESVALANNPDFHALIEESRRSYRDEGGVSLENVRKELGLKPKRRTRRPTRKA